MPKAAHIPSRIARLLSADAEQTTVVTPNRRLAAALKRDYDQAQKALGKQAWATPDIVPFATFLERTYRVLTAGDSDAEVPRLIDASHSVFIWEQVVRKSDASELLLLIPAAARQAMAAWQLAYAWQLFPQLKVYPLHEDGQVFAAWASRYRQLLREKNLLDPALLPEALADLLMRRSAEVGAMDRLRLPKKFFTAGFDIVTPQQRQFSSALLGLGIDVAALDPVGGQGKGTVARREFLSEDDELRACAQWAREIVAAGRGSRIGIVVPDLRGQRSQIERVFCDALQPMARASLEAYASQFEAQSRLFNISLGQRTSEYALVADALGLIDFSLRTETPFADVSRLLRTPFIAAAEREVAARAQLDALLREECRSHVSLPGLQRRLKLTTRTRMQRAVAEVPVLCQRIDAVASIADPVGDAPAKSSARSQSGARGKSPGPAHWSRHFAAVLAAWGFPGERALDSLDYQVLAKLHEALRSLASLQIVQQRMRADEALQQLRRILADAVFQPESADVDGAPIQIMGVLESAGQQFDQLWVTGLSASAWPLAARPNPLIPIAMQRRAGVPAASAAASLALDEQITTGWKQAAGVVMFSHAAHEGDGGVREESLAASALTADVPLDTGMHPPTAANYAEALQRASAEARFDGLEPIPDQALAPLPQGTSVAGGATVIRDQAACPFRAFARHRLGAKSLEEPAAGHDAAERGTLVHRMLSLVWNALGKHERLVSMSAEALAGLIDGCANTAIGEARQRGQEGLVGRFADIERARLCRLTAEWLDYERSRQPFEVVASEAAVATMIGPLAISLRLDRLDLLSDGTHALIDYKTGNASISGWLGDRLDEPQLPLYCRTAEQHVSALAFARLKRGKSFGFEGVSATDGALPDVAPIETKRGMADAGYASWDVLVQEWERGLDQLAVQFQRGASAVDPKRAGLTCKQCDLQSLCRIAEVAGAADYDDELPVNPADVDGGAGA